MNSKEKILIIQTAFIGDVVLATSLIESLYKANYQHIDFLVRNGNQGILNNNPNLNKIIVWDKKSQKTKNLFKLIFQIRKERYDIIINLQRFGSTGLLTTFSGAKLKIGFKKNPFSLFFNKRIDHQISVEKPIHETERNHQLIIDLDHVNPVPASPKLWPSEEDYSTISSYTKEEFIIIAPGSVWFTKQYPKVKWVELINQISEKQQIIIIGGKEDKELANEIILETERKKIINLCGQLSFLESAALMQKAIRCFVNDSAPLHFASAMNSRTTAIFCSTIPEFGFGPLGENAKIVETSKELGCRPCGLHGKTSCPEKHFECGMSINTNDLIKTIGKQ